MNERVRWVRQAGRRRERASSPFFFRFSFHVASFWYIYSMMVIFFELHTICLRWQCKRTNIVSFSFSQFTIEFEWDIFRSMDLLGLEYTWCPIFGIPYQMCWYLVRHYNAPVLRHFILMLCAYIWIRRYDCVCLMCMLVWVCVYACASIAYTHSSLLFAYYQFFSGLVH